MPRATRPSCPAAPRRRVSPTVLPTSLPAVLPAFLPAFLALLCLAPAAPACSRDEPADRPAAPSTTAPEQVTPRLVDEPCPDPGTPATVTCARLTVPEDRNRPGGRQVELAVLRIRPASAAGREDLPPVVHLHGGPGGGATDQWSYWSAIADVLGRELVVYDQRGAGRSRPVLDCPERSAALTGVLEGAGTWDDERRVMVDAIEACRRRLAAEGVDLDRYDTPTSSADLEDLRRALGQDRLDLLAISYGSRLALDYVRRHPDRVRAMVLDGVDPPGAGGPDTERSLPGEAIERLLAACEADTVCADAHPDLRAQLGATMARLDDRPAELVWQGTDLTGGRPMLVTGDDLYAGLYDALYLNGIAPMLPGFVAQVAAGDDSVFTLVADQIIPALMSGTYGTSISVNCADAGSQVREDAARRTAKADPGRASTLVLAGTDSYCDVWDVEPVSEDFAELIDADDAPPTLVLAGQLDPITPAPRARAVAAALGARYVELPLGGHAGGLDDACTQGVIRSFLADPDRVEDGCVALLEPPPWM